MTPEPRPIALGDNVVYALDLAEGGILLVDGGPDFGGAWESAVAQAKAHGFAPADVRAVLLTHAHIDHAGLAHRWAGVGARILAGVADLPALDTAGPRGGPAREARTEELRHHGCPEEVLERLSAPRRPSTGSGRAQMCWTPPPAAAVEPVEDGATFALAGGPSSGGAGAELRVLAAPGHTPGNLVAFVSPAPGATGDLYSGDTLLPDTIPTPGLHFLAGGGGSRWPSLPPFVESIRRLRDLPVRRVRPGHGEAVDDPQRLFERFEIHHARRARRIRALLAERPDSAYGVATRLFPHLPAERAGQAMTEVIGHFDVLLASGEAQCEQGEQGEGGVLVFRLSGLE